MSEFPLSTPTANRDRQPVTADAIRDRLQHTALTIEPTGESYRGVKARNRQQEIKSRNNRRFRLRR
jgi:hypothetical protein